MEISLSKSQAASIAPRECFALGQKITEVGSALAYADFFSRRLSLVSGIALRDVAAGVQTAATATGKLKEKLHGKPRGKTERFERDLQQFGKELRAKFIGNPVSTKDAIEIQQNMSILRLKAGEIWDSLRLMCPDRGTAAKASRKKKGKR